MQEYDMLSVDTENKERQGVAGHAEEQSRREVMATLRAMSSTTAAAQVPLRRQRPLRQQRLCARRTRTGTWFWAQGPYAYS